VTFDLTQPGLAQTLDCPFTVPAGTYTGAGPRFGETFELLISDQANGIFTDPESPTKLSATEPAGGAKALTLPNPAASLGGGGVRFPTPVTVKDGETLTVSVLLNALQRIQVNVGGGTIQLGADGNGLPGFPDAAMAVGTPAAIAFYVNDALGTAHSYNGSTMGMNNPLAIQVLYGNGMVPAFLNMSNGDLPGCGHIQVLFVFAGRGNGYLGLDGAGVLGWAGFSDVASTNYSAVMSMPQISTLGATTTFKCLTTTTDPAPPGDSFSSGAPVIPSPTREEVMTLVAK
jgi:hypothetical protein